MDANTMSARQAAITITTALPDALRSAEELPFVFFCAFMAEDAGPRYDNDVMYVCNIVL